MTDLLLIDLDGTLIDRATGFLRWAEGFLDSIGRRSDEELTWIVDADRDGLTSREQLFAALKARYDLRDDVPVLVTTYLDEFPPMIPEPTADTMSALRDAREAGWSLCILTNGGVRTQARKISSALVAAVDGYVISETIGFGKPDVEAFRAAADAVGRTLNGDTWMIGDRPETDVLGAVQAGIRSAWIARGETWDEGLPYRPTIRADDVRQAVSAILADVA